jgi:hypothetical protein
MTATDNHREAGNGLLMIDLLISVAVVAVVSLVLSVVLERIGFSGSIGRETARLTLTLVVACVLGAWLQGQLAFVVIALMWVSGAIVALPAFLIGYRRRTQG